MNPLIRKKFMLEAWDYNASLENPYQVSYYSPSGYTYRTNYLCFKKECKIPMLENSYLSIIENELKNEKNWPNSRTLSIQADEYFINPFFKHFFIQNSEFQLDLLKFHSYLKGLTSSSFEFLKDFDKNIIEPFLININHWNPYFTAALPELNNLMLEKNFNEGFRISIFKKYVEANLKVINKKPDLSKDLEDFLFKNYSQSINLIAPNVVAIQSRLKPVDTEKYLKCFNSEPNHCIAEHIKIDLLLKSFQIPGWMAFNYNSAIELTHSYLEEKNAFKFNVTIHQNQKEMDVFIQMKTADYTIDNYKNDLFLVLDFYRNNADLRATKETISKLFFNRNLNQALPPTTNKTKSNKI